MEISLSLECYKALTARLAHDGQTYDDVIRDLLEVDSVIEPDVAPTPFSAITDAIERARAATQGGFASRGLYLPDGTLLRARYKGKLYTATIVDGDWRDQNGEIQSSPSAAATAVTATNVNGLRFWEAQLPGEKGWRRLEVLRTLNDPGVTRSRN